MTEGHYAIGMRRGGTVWWDDGQQYVELMKRDGPVVIVGLDASGKPDYPNLARILKTATLAETEGLSYREAHSQLSEQGARVEGWWGSFARLLLNLYGSIGKAV